MTLDARALVAIVRREPGFDRIVDAIVEDDTCRISATALAGAAILLHARGESLPGTVIQIVIDRFDLTVVPFTKDHWKLAFREHEKHGREDADTRPRFGECLGAVAANCGSSLIRQ